MDAALVEYRPYLSVPASVRVELIGSSREELSLHEAASPQDPDTRHPELGPAFIVYSGSGTTTGPVVYVNYGLPNDYARLATAGIDVRARLCWRATVEAIGPSRSTPPRKPAPAA